jgi:hypothetical protein
VELASNLDGGTRGEFQATTQEFSWTLIEKRHQTGYPLTCPANLQNKIVQSTADGFPLMCPVYMPAIQAEMLLCFNDVISSG